MKFPLFGFEKDWEWYPVVFEDEPVAPGEIKTVWDFERAGFIYYVFAKTDNPDLALAIDLVSKPGKIEAVLTARELWTEGFSNSINFRVLRWDDKNNIYAFEWYPGIMGFPGCPFKDKNIAKVINPTAVSSKFTLSAWIILLR